MIRALKYLLLALIAVVLITLAFANGGMVTVYLLPAALAEAVGLSCSLQLPLFLVIVGGILIGLLLGFIWEWLRGHRTRASASAVRKQAKKLEREVKDLKKTDTPEDEVLALLDKPAR